MAGRALRFFLDNCVPDSVGRVLTAAGHIVIYQRDAIATNSADMMVALASAENDAILVTFDKDHKTLASRFQVSHNRLKKLSRVDLACTEPEAAKRIQIALDFIQSEWEVAQKSSDRRMFVVVQGNALKTIR